MNPAAPPPKLLASLFLSNDTFSAGGAKNTPFTRFKFAARLKNILVETLDHPDITLKNFDKHFNVVVEPGGVRAQALTELASTLVEENMKVGSPKS